VGPTSNYLEIPAAGKWLLSVLMIIPAIVFVLLTQRRLTEGLTFGALKG
jgi:ABC-type glycerol-3-phosphate transport system permease component